MNIYEEMGFARDDENLNETVLYSIGRIYSLLSKLAHKEYGPFGLNHTKFNVLMVVKHIGGDDGIKQNEISSKLVVSDAGITKVIDSLEKRNLVRRESEDGDRRINLVKITRQGAELLDRIWEIHVKMADELMGRLSEREKKSLINLLDKVRTG